MAAQVPVAAVQLDPTIDETVAELAQLVAISLANSKRLHSVVIVDVIPRLPSGKVLRRALRAEWKPEPATHSA